MIVVQYLLFVTLLGPLVTSFAPMATSPRRSCDSFLFAASDEEAKAPKEDSSDFSDFTIEGKSDYSVDWDAEWKKVVANQGQPEERPGKGYYKSDAELAALRAANQAREKALQTAANMPSLPTWNAVKGDWKVRVERRRGL
jgi:hypothetical protein